MARVEIDSDLCENSQVCEAVCPEDVFAIDQGTIRVASPTECILCWKCVENCSSGAVRLED